MHSLTFEFLLKNFWFSILMNKQLSTTNNFLNIWSIHNHHSGPSAMGFLSLAKQNFHNNKFSPIASRGLPLIHHHDGFGGQLENNDTKIRTTTKKFEEHGQTGHEQVGGQSFKLNDIDQVSLDTKNVTADTSAVVKPMTIKCRHYSTFKENRGIDSDKVRDYLICEAIGNPMPHKVTWLHNNVITGPSIERRLDDLTMESALQLPSEFLVGGGGGNFTFIATNPIGNITQHFFMGTIGPDLD